MISPAPYKSCLEMSLRRKICFNIEGFFVKFLWSRFDLYFRRNPFGGEYTIFAGLEECIRLIANFKFTEEEISFVKQALPSSCEVTQFIDYVVGIQINFYFGLCGTPLHI